MTVVNPDSIAGITSVTSSGTTLEFYDVNGNLLDVSANLTGELTVGTGATISSPGASIIDFETNGSERLRIGSSGQIGIAGANYGSSGQVLTSQGSGSAVTWTTITGTTINNNADNRVITGSGTANTLEGESGLTYNGSILNVTGDVALPTTNRVYFGNSDVAFIKGEHGGSAYLALGANTEHMRILRNGNIGINQSTPTRNLHIEGTAHQSGIIIHTAGNHSTAIDMDSNRSGAGSGVAELNFKWNGTAVGQIGAYSGSDTSNKDDGHIHFGTASAGSIVERVRIDSNGLMGLGTNSPSSYNNKAYNFVIASSGHAGMTIAGGTTSDSSIYFADGTSGAAQYAGWVQYEHDNNALTFGVNTSERFRITSGGQVQIPSGSLRVTDSGNSTANSTHTTGALLCNLIRSETSNNNSYTGTYFMNRNAAGGGIKAVGIVETGLKVGDFTSNLAAAEKIKLTYDGHVEIKTDGGRLKIGAGNDLQMYHDNTGNYNHITCATNGHLKMSANSHQFYDYSGVTQYLRVQSGDDRVRVYGEAAVDGTSGGADGLSIAVNGGASCPLYFGTETHSAQKSMYLKGYWIYLRGHQNEGIKFVFSQGSGTAPRSDQYSFKYNSATRPGGSSSWDGFSDTRAKENVQSITNGIETIKKLRPVTFDWTNDYADSMGMWTMDKSDPKPYNWVSKKENGYDTDMKNGRYGFIAQEFETVFPKDIRQDKFTLGDTEIPDFKTINHDSLIPSLTAAIKELITKVESIEAQQANDAAYEAKIDKIIDYFKL